MSSFLVENKTINTIVTYLSQSKDLEFTKRQVKKKLGFDLNTYQGKKELAEFMWRMNLRATGQRYNGEIEDFRSLNFEYRFQPYYNNFSALKALSCWLYQCTEGDVYRSEEYKFFEWLKGEIAYIIVGNMKEYQDAQGWH